jgi:chorismate-pyruvate lyase
MNRELKLLYPLDEFYSQAGVPLPTVSQVKPEDVPEPFKQLLVHNADMTPTLEAFHGETIHLRVMERHQNGDAYSRQVVLVLNGDERPVEFGAIVIYLQHFPPAAREEILQGWKPLGSILRAHNVQHVSQPQAFIRISSDALINEVLGLTKPHELYGRRNVLLDSNSNVLAEVVEILPLTKTTE